MTPQHKQALEELRGWMVKYEVVIRSEGDNQLIYVGEEEIDILSDMIDIDCINTLLKQDNV